MTVKWVSIELTVEINRSCQLVLLLDLDPLEQLFTTELGQIVVYCHLHYVLMNKQVPILIMSPFLLIKVQQKIFYNVKMTFNQFV